LKTGRKRELFSALHKLAPSSCDVRHLNLSALLTVGTDVSELTAMRFRNGDEATLRVVE
jgi:hypothetical protein